MPSDPSYGTTGFFSYLWVKRKPVYSASATMQGASIVDDSGANSLITDDGLYMIVSDPTGLLITETLVRWD